MKLKTLLLLSLSSLLLTIMLAILAFNTKTMQSYIENQVYSNTEDTAYSLGLSLASLGDGASPIEMDLMISAIFDSGYYEYIKLYDANKTLLIEKKQKVVIKDVPQWFISFIPLHISAASSDISVGWSISKVIKVKGHTGFAYYELWKNFKSFLLFFGVITLISLIVVFIIVHLVLKSLAGIKNQANAIDKHTFILQENDSFIYEFKVLTGTMNHIVKKVESIFNSELQTFQKYQALNYKDEETNLANKKHLTLKLKEILESDEDNSSTMLAMLHIDGLEEYKKESKYLEYKDLLLHIVKIVEDVITQKGELSRISRQEFAILFDTNVNVEESLTEIHGRFTKEMKQYTSDTTHLCLNSGYTPIVRSESSTKILSRADYALQKSKMDGCTVFGSVKSLDVENALSSLGKNEWRDKFAEILKEDRLTIALQKSICLDDGSSFHDEALLRIQEKDGTSLPAMLYLPMAHSLGLIEEFDQTIIDLVIELLYEDDNPKAINISKEFVANNLSFQELRMQLVMIKNQYSQKLHFECRESDIVNNLEAYINFSQMIEGTGQCFGIDRFSGLENIEYIKQIRPTYIKVASSVLLELYKKDYVIINSLHVLCEVMDIKIIVTAVQSSEQLEALKALEYNYFQGNYFAEPKLLESLSKVKPKND